MVDITQILTMLKTFGALVVTAGLMVTGYLIPRSVYLREVARADAYESLAKDALAAMAKLVQATK
jgi:hypothetical protein